jgi:SAM-dependent methyltransferase
MKLNTLEFALMNNPVRAASQRRIETPLLIGPDGTLAGKQVLEVGCGRGVGVEILLGHGAASVAGFDLDPAMVALAQKRLAQYGARVWVGDAARIAAPDASFDAVEGACGEERARQDHQLAQHTIPHQRQRGHAECASHLRQLKRDGDLACLASQPVGRQQRTWEADSVARHNRKLGDMPLPVNDAPV